ncbi:MAG: FAD-binding protein, partial [Alphaproteobacteria bacterium]|nr:FAD-binding protein [Alphaproteobacteria bacterium]
MWTTARSSTYCACCTLRWTSSRSFATNPRPQSDDGPGGGADIHRRLQLLRRCVDLPDHAFGQHQRAVDHGQRAGRRPDPRGSRGGVSAQTRRWDVLIAGGGNAALCAAITARLAGRSVLVLEAAPKFYRGGNTRHTRNMRCAHAVGNGMLTGPYPEDEFLEDLRRVTDGVMDGALASLTIARSAELWDWLGAQGVRFQAPLAGTLGLGRTNAFFLGGGRAMLNTLYRRGEDLGVEVRYDAEVVDLAIDGDVFVEATVRTADGMQTVRARTLVVAS